MDKSSCMLLCLTSLASHSKHNFLKDDKKIWKTIKGLGVNLIISDIFPNTICRECFNKINAVEKAKREIEVIDI